MIKKQIMTFFFVCMCVQEENFSKVSISESADLQNLFNIRVVQTAQNKRVQNHMKIGAKATRNKSTLA